MRILASSLSCAAMAALLLPAVASAHAPSGAIFTTLEDGTEVNLNHFPAKEDVYLDGGPGPGAPRKAAGLDPGTYVFMVTDPPGKVLLSSDEARCRQFVVEDDVITDVVAQPDGCEHLTGFDQDHGAATVQLFPYDDTPNPGGVYKVWATRVEDFPAECLETVDCGLQGKHGFLPRHSKTDNFKVDGANEREIDCYFYEDADGDLNLDGREKLLAGRKMVWTDTNGVENIRYSDPGFMYGLYAHVEVPEDEYGLHYIEVPDQPGCIVTHVHINDVDVDPDGDGRYPVDVSANIDYMVEVACLKTKGGGGRGKK